MKNRFSQIGIATHFRGEGGNGTILFLPRPGKNGIYTPFGAAAINRSRHGANPELTLPIRIAMDQRPALIALLQETRRVLLAQQEMGIESYPLSEPLRKFLARRKKSQDPGGGGVLGGRPASRPLLAAAVADYPPRVAVPAAAPEEPERLVESLADIQARTTSCGRCSRQQGRVLFGQGASPARLLIVGDWPSGADEAAGQLFSGEEGLLLGKMLQAIRVGMEEVYLTTVVKCRVVEPGPTVEEVKKSCLNFLLAQIGVVGPKVVLAMGTLAAQTLFNSSQPLSRLRGRAQPYLGRLLLATYPPAFLLKNPEMKKAAWADLQLLEKKLAE